ncbi:DUF2924 domain-containing protein [Devosia sp. A369]
MRALSPSELARELVALEALKTPTLQAKWRQVFSTEPPRKMRAGFLQRAIAYRLQEQVFGGLKSDTQRELKRQAMVLRKQQNGRASIGVQRLPSPHRQLSPGTRLMREWNGTTELVDVVDSGFVWRSRSYRTLSAVAVAITGTKWSGPKFFGLDRPQPCLVKPASGGARRGFVTSELTQ